MQATRWTSRHVLYAGVALLLSTTDSSFVSARGEQATVAASQKIARLAMRVLCREMRDSADAWWFYEVRFSPPGGHLVLYDEKGRPRSEGELCGAWTRNETMRALHPVWDLSPEKVTRAVYTTPTGERITYLKEGETP